MSPLLLLGIIVAALVALAIYYDPKRRAKGKLPPIEAPIPFVGALLDFAKHPVDSVRKAYEKHGDIFTMHIGGQNMTFVIGPEAHEVFFKASDEELSPKEAYKFMIPVFGKGVVYDSPTHVMYEQLKFIKSGLLVGQLRKHVPSIEDEAKEFFGTFGESGEMDLLSEMNKLTVRTASRCLLGKEIRNDPKVASDFAQLYHDLEAGISPISVLFPNAPIPSHRKRDQARISIQKLFSKVIKQRRSNPNEEDEDMLDTLMRSEYKTGEILDDNSITGLLLALLFAGQHTSGITATWTGFYLATRPDIKKEVMEEQEEIIKEFGEEISFDSLRKSVKLENCIRETIRMLPPLIMLMRKVMQPLKYKDYVIPVGDNLCVSPAVAMRLDSVFPDANTWNPHRFENELPQYSILSFGGGRHGCPGESFAFLQIKTVWTVLLREFDFEVPAGKVPPTNYSSMVVGPESPALIRFKRKVKA